MCDSQLNHNFKRELKMADPNKIPSLLDSPKLRLSTWNAQEKTRPSLKVSIWNNNPRFECGLNSKTAQGRDNWITAPLDPWIFETLMELLKEIADGPNDRKEKAVSLEPDKQAEQGQKAAAVAVADLWFGKDKDGRVYASVIDKKAEKPIVQFFFGPADVRYFKGFHGDGQEWTPAEMSVRFARSFASLMMRTVSNVIDRTYKPSEFQGNKGGGGGYQNNRQGGGGYQQRSSGGGGRAAEAEVEMDEGIPF